MEARACDRGRFGIVGAARRAAACVAAVGRAVEKRERGRPTGRDPFGL